MLRRSICLLLLACSISAYALKPFTKVETIDENTEKIHLSMSLYKTATTVERTYIEEVLNHMNRAIFEATNGAHYLGTIQIFQNRKQPGNADIIWEEVSNAYSTVGGIDSRYGKIRIGSKETEIGPNLLETAEGREVLGYKLAHEFAHYAYSLLDQYAKLDDDEEDDFGLMVHPEDAVGNNYQWLNFDRVPFGVTKNNEQYRVWKTSSWGLLTQPLLMDPQEDEVTVIPPRRKFPALNSFRAPTSSDIWTHDGSDYEWMKVLLETETPNTVDVKWMDEDIELVIILDKSGSMSRPTSAPPIDQVIRAANSLIDILPAGKCVVGVTTFASSNGTLVPMTSIPNPVGGAKNDIKDIIGTINADGTHTALYSGAVYGLNLLDTYKAANSTNAVRLAMLLTDGENNVANDTEVEVINQFNNSKVPLFTFGYGSGIGHTTLMSMAYETNGDFYYNLEGNDAPRAAFLEVFQNVSQMQFTGVEWRADSGFAIQDINTNMTSINIVIEYMVDNNSSSIDFEIRDADDVLVPATVTKTDPGTPPFPQTATITINSSAIAAHASGDWNVDFVRTGNISFGNTDPIVTIESDEGLPETDVEIIGGSHVSYPEPLLITSSTIYGHNITGLSVSGTLECPDGSTVPVTLYDDGTHGDATAGDGVYSLAYTDYDQDGTYKLTVEVNNDEGVAMLTNNGNSFSGGTTLSTPFSMPFSRTQTLHINVTGVVADDHGNDQYTATSLPLDNSTIAGKIESYADVDYFAITTTSNTEDVLIRISNMSSDMKPEVTVYGEDGTMVGYSNINVGSTTNGYLMVRIPEGTGGDMLFVAVNHLEDNLAGMVYKISAGEEKFGDAAAGSSVEVFAKDEGLHENNIVKPRIVVKNKGTETLNGFTVCYHLTTEDGKTPIVENYYAPHSNISVDNLGDGNYRVNLDYNGITLEPGASLPDHVGSVIGIRYENWSTMDKLNDFSNPGTSDYARTERIAVFSNDGVLISGSFPLN